MPRAVVSKRFEGELQQELLERLVPRYWKQAQGETDLDPLLPPQVSAVELEEGQPLRFTASVEVRPEIEVGILPDFDLPPMDTEPTADEIEHAVEDLRKSRGTDWKTVERAAGAGDGVVADLTPLDDEGEPAGEPSPAQYAIGDPNIWEELSVATTGLAAGGSTEFERKDGEGEEAVTRRFGVKVTEIRELELPPFDDEFAKAMAGLDSVAELEADIAKRLGEAKEQAIRDRRRQALLTQLCQHFPVDLPPRAVEHESRRLMEDYAQNLARQGVDLDNAGIDWANVAAEAKPQAERNLHARLVLDAVAEAECVVVGDAEVESTIAAVAQAQHQPPQAVRRSLDEAGKIEELKGQLRRDKTIRQLLGEPLEPEAGATEAGAEAAADDASSAADQS